MLRRIILLHIGLVTFEFHSSQIQHVFIFTIFGNINDPKPIILDFGSAKLLKLSQEKSNSFRIILFLKSQNLSSGAEAL